MHADNYYPDDPQPTETEKPKSNVQDRQSKLDNSTEDKDV